MELLRDIFKFDLKLLLDKLNLDNFVSYSTVINEILQSETVDVKQKQEYSDKIVVFCLQRLFPSAHQEADIDESTNETTVILKYIQLCTNYSSKSTLDFQLKFYINYFMKCILLSQTNFSLNTTKIADEMNQQLGQKCDEKLKFLLKSDFNFNLKQILLLNNYYSVVMQHLITGLSGNEAVKSVCNSTVTENQELLKLLIDVSLNFLHEMDSSNLNLIRLCIHTIEKLIKINSSFKQAILSKCFETIRKTYDEIYNDSGSLISNKKRLESHCEDVNMYLLTTIADFYITTTSADENGNYLSKYQFWYLLQVALIHTNALTLTNNVNITCNDLNGREAHTFLFDSSLEIWNDFFLCIEMLEETSIHVIKPCLTKVDNILNEVKNGRFHLTWLFILLQRSFLHESKFVVRWALSYFYQTKSYELAKTNFYDREHFLRIMNRFIMGPFIVILQEVFLYYKVDDMPYVDNAPILANRLSEFLNLYVNSLVDKEEKLSFVSNFTSIILSYTWSAPCLLFITKAFYDLNLKAMSTDIIRNVIKIITQSMTTHEVLLRSASQTFLISGVIKHIQTSELDETMLKELLDLVNCLSSTECLIYMNSTWNRLVQWFKNIICPKPLSNEINQEKLKFLSSFVDKEFDLYYNSSDVTDEFTIKTTSLKLSKLILLISDVNDAVLSKISIQLSDRLCSANKYVYMSSQKIDKSFYILNSMLNALKNSKFIKRAAKSYQFLKQLHNSTIAEVLTYLLRKANDTSEQALHFDSVFLYSQLLQNLLDTTIEIPSNLSGLVIKKLCTEYIPVIISNLSEKENEINKKFSTLWKLFISMNYFSVICESNYNSAICEQLSSMSNSEYVQNLVIFKTPTKLVLSNAEKDLSKDLIENLNNNYSLFNGSYLETLWKIYEFYLKNHKLLTGKANSSALSTMANLLLNKYEESLDLISSFSLASMIKACSNFIGLLKFANDETNKYYEHLATVIERLYQLVWNTYYDIKNFSEAYQSFVEILFSPELFNYTENVPTFIMNISLDILVRSNDRSGLVKPMLDYLLEAFRTSSIQKINSFQSIFVDCVAFGTVYKKEKRYVKDIEIFVESMVETFGTNQFIKPEYIHDISVRITMINYLLQDKNLNDQFFGEFIKAVILKDKKCQIGNIKLFSNSLVHRERFRLWQTILAILPRLNEANMKSILAYGEELILIENQPSIRILMEWIFIRLYLTVKPDENQLWKRLDNSSVRKVGYICSWISIMSQLTPFIDEQKRITYFKNLVSLILSQILSANFHIRTYAEATLIKLYLLCNDKQQEKQNGLNSPHFVKSPEIVPLLDSIYSILKDIIDDKERYSNLIMSHFYFQFNPVNDYSINTIFNWFPYLCDIAEDELIRGDLYRAISLKKHISEVTQDDVQKFSLPLKLNTDHEHFERCQIGIWKFTAYKDENSFEPAVSIEDLQKKITPWHSLIPKQQDFESITKSRKVNPYDDDKSQFGLILVASLIDKGPNLGGLCRTSEIFNVKEFVIANTKFTEDKQFQSLAVTAEKWLNIKEVQPKHLKAYLMQMKLSGYTLVGVEQTANSVKLNEYQFPKKTLLLLGNEREGIPVELIQLLDVCVEIPQLGIIRSLNVHVSAAITIWEYTKQTLDHI